MGEWRLITPEDQNTDGWLYTPPENLYRPPLPSRGEVRFDRPRNYTWATHIIPCPRPDPPS